MGLPAEFAVFLAIGLFTGILSGIFGIGGGFIRIPVFVQIFPWIGVAHTELMHMAIGTSVALILPTAVASTLRQYRQGNLDLLFYRHWAVAVLCGVTGGLLLVPYASTRDLQILFLALVITVIAYLGFAAGSIRPATRAPGSALRFLAGAGIGLISALTGTGGGALTTPALTMFAIPLKKAIAIASATGLVIGLVSTTGFVYHGLGSPSRPPASLGYVDLVVFAAMAPTVFVGASAGARISNRLSDLSIRRGFIVLLCIVAATMIHKLWFQ